MFREVYFMKKKLFTKLVMLFITFFLCFKIIQILKVDAKTSSHKTSNSSSSSQMNNKKALDLSKFPSEETLHAFLSDTKNRINVYNTANSLNNGDSANTCVYFISEVLRQNGFNIPTYVCNTTQILEYFDTLKLKRNSDYSAHPHPVASHHFTPEDRSMANAGSGNRSGGTAFCLELFAL